MTQDYRVAKDYVVTFWPLWLSVNQWRVFPTNSLFGPNKITPVFKSVVAINVDTLYGATILDLTKEPLILTVPDTEVGYSVFLANALGYLTDSGIPGHVTGTPPIGATYILSGPSTSPGGQDLGGDYQPIELPYDRMMLIFRADVSLPNGTSMADETLQFRTGLKLANLTEYEKDPEAGALQIVPVDLFSTPYKVMADTMVQEDPIQYLTELQQAVASKFVPRLTPVEQALSRDFDEAFNNRQENGKFAKGARSGYNKIIQNYLNNADKNGWIHFTDMANWGDDFLNRASTTEYIQWGNSIETAAYYHTFVDSDSSTLTGKESNVYKLTFEDTDLPPAARFWSVTAYTPDNVELIPNSIEKYHVASYTDGLEADENGTISIYISETQPNDIPVANWLPVSNSTFNIMLRVYGIIPGSTVESNTYVPPAIFLL